MRRQLHDAMKDLKHATPRRSLAHRDQEGRNTVRHKLRVHRRRICRHAPEDPRQVALVVPCSGKPREPLLRFARGSAHRGIQFGRHGGTRRRSSRRGDRSSRATACSRLLQRTHHALLVQTSDVADVVKGAPLCAAGPAVPRTATDRIEDRAQCVRAEVSCTAAPAVPRLRIILEAPVPHGLKIGGRELRQRLVQARHPLLSAVAQDPMRRVVHDDAHAVPVRRVRVLHASAAAHACQHLWCHIIKGANDALAAQRVGDVLREAKVCDLRHHSFRQEDVWRLDVAVHDALVVHVLQPECRLVQQRDQRRP